MFSTVVAGNDLTGTTVPDASGCGCEAVCQDELGDTWAVRLCEAHQKGEDEKNRASRTKVPQARSLAPSKKDAKRRRKRERSARRRNRR